MKEILLSFCIATYNRKKILLELINTLLEIKRDDYDIVVTDNASDDGTMEMLQSMNCKKVKYFRNKSNIGIANNIIKSVFNADGKYAFYINDRDLIDISLIDSVFNILKNMDLSFVALTGKRIFCASNKLNIYDKGADSLLKHSFLHHPTGLIYNAEIVHEKLDEKTYRQYGDTYSYDFMMYDVVNYADSAVFDIGIWYQRKNFKTVHKSYISSNSLQKLYFYPEVRCDTGLRIAEYLFLKSKHTKNYGKDEREKIAKRIYAYITKSLMEYKGYLSNKEECAHYGIKPYLVTMRELKRALKNWEEVYYNILLQLDFSEEFLNEMKNDFYKEQEKAFVIKYYRWYLGKTKLNILRQLSRFSFLRKMIGLNEGFI